VGDEHADFLDDAPAVVDFDPVTDAVGLGEDEVETGGRGGEQLLEREADEEDEAEGVRGQQDEQRLRGDAELAQRDEGGEVEDAVPGRVRGGDRPRAP